jgi:SAM-dependent methyltransferase
LDIDARFLTDMPDNVEVRQLDIRTERVETAAYDLVHCRAFLMHLPDPAATLVQMADALIPGGLLLAEEADYGLVHYGGDPESDELTRVARWALDRMTEAGIVDAAFGRRLPPMLAEAGLELLGAHVDTGVSRPGEARYEFAARTTLDAAPRLLAAGILDESGAARMREYFAQPTAVITGPSLVSAWGRKPGR